MQKPFGCAVGGDETYLLLRNLEVVFFKKLLDIFIGLDGNPNCISRVPVHHIEGQVVNPQVRVELRILLMEGFQSIVQVDFGRKRSLWITRQDAILRPELIGSLAFRLQDAASQIQLHGKNCMSWWIV